VTLPTAVRAALADALGHSVVRVTGVGGGCISPSYRATTATGRTVFVKTAPRGAAQGLLECEAFSLRRLADAAAIRVPGVIAQGRGWLVLEWLEPSAGSTEDWQRLGRGLARLHRASRESYGWDHDNFIGSLRQQNAASDSWPEFWVERRLRPQLAAAEAHLSSATMQAFHRLLDEVADRLATAEPEGPSLLHGDLWSGNVHMTAAGPALIDPASCYGHREVDLAMTRLFGGFPQAFYDAYDAEWPPLPALAARMPIYQLYYLLVHVNLFGGSYIAGTERTLRAALK
jgi:fructosamine-3-kinase